MKLRSLTLTALLGLALAACGGSDSTPSNASGAEEAAAKALSASEEAVENAVESSEEFADGLVESLEDAQAAVGGGSMTLTVGDTSWTFEPVLCAFGPDEIGQEGAEFVLSSVQDGKQMYVSIDSFGHSVSLDDIVDFENPSVSVRSGGEQEFISLDGKSFSGEADFFDDTTESFEAVAGSFSGTCP